VVRRRRRLRRDSVELKFHLHGNRVALTACRPDARPDRSPGRRPARRAQRAPPPPPPPPRGVEEAAAALPAAALHARRGPAAGGARRRWRGRSRRRRRAAPRRRPRAACPQSRRGQPPTCARPAGVMTGTGFPGLGAGERVAASIASQLTPSCSELAVSSGRAARSRQPHKSSRSSPRSLACGGDGAALMAATAHPRAGLLARSPQAARYGEVWGGMGRYREVWGGMGR